MIHDSNPQPAPSRDAGSCQIDETCLYGEMIHLSTRINLPPSLVEVSMHAFKTCMMETDLHGRDARLAAATLLFLAAKASNVPVTMCMFIEGTGLRPLVFRRAILVASHRVSIPRAIQGGDL